MKLSVKGNKMSKRNNRKNKSNLNNANENILKYLRIFLLCALGVIIFYPPYLRGLYFEREQFPAQIIVFSIFLMFWVYKWLKNDRVFLKTYIDYAAFGFVIVYFISIFFAVSTRAAISEWLKYCMYFAVFYMISDLTSSYKSRLFVLWTIIVSSVGVSILGLDSSAGGKLVNIFNNIFENFGVKEDVFFGLFVGNRIHSTIQYPNALAAFLIAVFFVCIGLLIAIDKWWTRAILGASSFLVFSTFILTQSRGAQVLFLLAIIVFVLALPKGNRVRGVTYLLSMSIPSAAFAFLISSRISQGSSNGVQIWLIILLGTSILSVIGIATQYISNITERVNWKIYAASIFGLVLFISFIMIYLANSSMPVELAHTLDEKDSFKIISKDIALKPNKEYILSYQVNASMEHENIPYTYRVDVNSKTEKNILFGGVTNILINEFKNSQGVAKEQIVFTVPENNKLTEIKFINYYSGTKITIDNASVLDAESGKIIKKLVLKNKYNLEVLNNRFENLIYNKSWLTREIYYKDGINMFFKNWFIGSGGGAWPFIYFSNQSYLYWSTQAHNYPLQVAIETGILGVIVLLTLIGALIWKFVLYKKSDRNNDSKDNDCQVLNEITKQKIVIASIFTAIAYMLVHSVMDFDLSLSAIMLVLWQFIAVLNSQTKDLRDRDNLTFKMKYVPLIGIVMTSILIFVPINFNAARAYDELANKALQEENIDLAKEKMSKAVSKDPWMAKYKVDYANLLIKRSEITQDDFEKANNNIKRAEVLANNDPNIITKIGAFYVRTRNFDKGLNMLEKAQELRPFNPLEWQQMIQAYIQVINFHLNQQDYDNGLKMIDKTIAIIEKAQEVNKKNMNPFIFNADTMENIEKIKYLKDSWNTDNVTAVNNVVFYSINDMDVDSDGISDQWKINNYEDVSIKIENGIFNVQKNGNSNSNYIYTRELNFEESKEYIIVLELLNGDEGKSLSFFVNGIMERAKEFEKTNNLYSANIVVPKGFEDNNNFLRIYLKDYDLKIKSIIVKSK